jgi:hypothetical protein
VDFQIWVCGAFPNHPSSSPWTLFSQSAMELLRELYLEGHELDDQAVVDSIDALISEIRDLPQSAHTCKSMLQLLCQLIHLATTSSSTLTSLKN